MSDDRKKPGVAFWAAVVLMLPVLYLLSAGPFVWLCSHGWLSSTSADRVARSFYGPITWLDENGPQPCQDAIHWYAGLWQ